MLDTTTQKRDNKECYDSWRSNTPAKIFRINKELEYKEYIKIIVKDGLGWIWIIFVTKIIILVSFAKWSGRITDKKRWKVNIKCIVKNEISTVNEI